MFERYSEFSRAQRNAGQLEEGKGTELLHLLMEWARERNQFIFRQPSMFQADAQKPGNE